MVIGSILKIKNKLEYDINHLQKKLKFKVQKTNSPKRLKIKNIIATLAEFEPGELITHFALSNEVQNTTQELIEGVNSYP